MGDRDAPSLRAVLEHRANFHATYERRDPIAADRARWRARTMRTLGDFGPGSRILELLPGQGLLTNALFEAGGPGLHVDTLGVDALASLLTKEVTTEPSYDAVVGVDVLDHQLASETLVAAHGLLKPGGAIVFVESNPWNPVLQARRRLSSSSLDRRRLPDRAHLYELMSSLGYVHTFAVYSDFVFPPLSRKLMWALKNSSILLQNTPGIQRFAGSIVVAGRKPPTEDTYAGPTLAAPLGLEHAVSIVVPCHNEEANIERLVTALDARYRECIHEFVLVDDCSVDATPEIIDRLAAADDRIVAVHRQQPPGVGRALRDGYGAASGEWVLSMDSDFEHLLGDLRDLFAGATADCDVVVGSRFSLDSVLLRYPFAKIVSNRLFHLIGRYVVGVRFRDLTNNMKLMRRVVVDELTLLEDGFAANAETGLLPLLLGYRVREVPISWIDRSPSMGESSFSLHRVGDGYVRVLWHAARWRTGAGRYGPRRSQRALRATLR